MFNFQYDAKLLKLQSAKAQSCQASNVNSDIFRKVCRKRIVHGIPSLLDRATYLLYDTVSVQPLMPLGLIQPFVGPFPLGETRNKIKLNLALAWMKLELFIQLQRYFTRRNGPILGAKIDKFYSYCANSK